MANKTDKNIDLVINQMESEEQLKSLQTAGQLEPNQLYMTPDDPIQISVEWGEITGDINSNTSLTDELNKKVSKQNVDIVQDLDINVSNDIVTMTKKIVNLNDSTLTPASQQKTIIQDATQDRSGLMTSTDKRALDQAVSDISNLKGQTTRLLYTTSTTPTAVDINNFVVGQGYTTPFSGIAVVVDQTFHIWHYYVNESTWKDDGPDTVSNFTNTNAGMIKGSTESGKVYANADGTGSVNGFDTLKSQVETNTSSINTNTSNITKNTNDIVTANESISALSSSKQDNLVSGTNIKTINNESILGSGNIEIQAGGSEYTAGNGLKLTDKEFSIDTNVVAQQADLSKALFSSTTNEEVWVFPNNLKGFNSYGTSPTFKVNFISNKTKFSKIVVDRKYNATQHLFYDSTTVCTIQAIYQRFDWLGDGYKTIALEKPATGELLAFLQSTGAVKQGESGTPNKNTGDIGIIKQKTNDNFYPKTFVDCIYDDNGNSLNNLMPVANPTLDGTEDNLTALSVNGTKYKIAGGGSGDYIAGNGINITDKTISADTNVLATKEDIPAGETDITFNGTPTTTTEDLSNVVIGDTTYLVPSNTEVNAMKVTINNSLQLPETAPTATELVGIGTDKSQVNVGIGSGLSLENGTLKVTSGENSSYNPNLLLNDEMTINQRGKSVYYGENAYGTDRWMCVDESAFMRLNSSSQWAIGLEDTDSAGERIAIKQIIENYQSLKGQTVTLTLSYSNLTESVSGTTQLTLYDGVKTETVALTSSGTAILTATISSNADRVEVRIKTSATGTDTSLVFKYCKLELGGSSTPLAPKNIGLALTECQRYYQKLSTFGCSNIPTTATSFDAPINLFTPLRTTPTLTLSAKPLIIGNGNSISSTSYSISSVKNNKAIINLQCTQSMTLNQVYVLSDVIAELDAEMY